MNMVTGEEVQIQQTECVFEGEANSTVKEELLSRLKSLARFQEDLTYKEFVRSQAFVLCGCTSDGCCMLR